MTRRMQNPVLVTTDPPDQYPVTLEQAKQHLKIDLDDEDSLIQGVLIPAATEHAEGFLNRRLMTQTVELRLDSFPLRGFPLLADPIQSVTSVKYDDVNGTEQTLSTSVYETDLTAFRGWIQPKFDQVWPTTYPKIHAVRIAMEVGFEDAASVPMPIRQAILMHVTHLKENPEPINIGNIGNSIPLGYEALLWPHRLVSV